MTDFQLPSVTTSLPIGSLDAYVRRVNDLPFLTSEEEYQLATQFRDTGDLKAAQKLALAHLRYVVRVARGYQGYGLSLADLIQEGTIGLMKAVKRFDPQVGVRLVSFSVHWIKAEIHEFVLRNWRIVKVATTKAQRKLFFNLRSAKKRLGWNTAEEVNAIAKDLGVSTKDVLVMEQRLNARDVQFDLTDSDQETPRAAPVDYLVSSQADPGRELEKADWEQHQAACFRSAFAKLDARSQAILEQRWLSPGEKATLQTLANTFQVSPERIRQLEKNAIEKIKALIVA